MNFQCLEQTKGRGGGYCSHSKCPWNEISLWRVSLGAGRKLHGALRAAVAEHAPTTPTVMLQNKTGGQIEWGEPSERGREVGEGERRERGKTHVLSVLLLCEVT